MSTLAGIVAEILELEARDAAKTEDEVDSEPGPPASEDQIAAAEHSRGREFPAGYRNFLASHDGWKHFEWGTSLYSTAELTGEGYERGYIEEMEDGDEVPGELRRAITIGASENDATLVLLLEDGSIVEWLYDEQARHADLDAYLADRRDTLAEMLDEAGEAERKVQSEWDPKVRAKSEAALAKQVRKLLASAPTTAPRSKPPRVRARPPRAVRVEELVAKRKRKSVAEVTLHLVLYLGAYPTQAEVVGSFRAFRKHFPVRGPLDWMLADEFFPTTSKSPDDEAFADKLRIAGGHYGLRAEITVAKTRRYILNVRGVPAGDEDDEERPRASFCEVIVPASEDPLALEALARELFAILPVRSGHGGFATYVWDTDAEPDPNAEIFEWCRRWFGIDVGTIDGWLPGALTRLHGPSWLTLLGPAFTSELERAKRLEFGRGIRVERSDRGALIRAGTRPSLGDVRRGEFPKLVAEVERALDPLIMRHYDDRGWVSFGSVMFTTITEDLEAFRSHRATAAFLYRLIDPAGFLGPTPRERGEALLEKVATGKNKHCLAEWRKEAKTGSPDFDLLLRMLFNATVGRAATDEAIEALLFAAEFDDGVPGNVMSQLLYGWLQREEFDAAIEFMPKALAYADDEPSILHNAACIYARAGRLARAMACVEQAASLGYAKMAELQLDDDLARLRGRAAWRRVFESK